MEVSTRVKIVVVLILVFGSVGFLALVDLGLNAGRIHYGVNVRGVDVGGLTVEEAASVLQRYGKRLREAPVVFSAEGIECSFIPNELGWGPKPKKTAESAREIGFSGGLGGALRDRITAYFSGVEIDWGGTAKAAEIGALIDDCEEQAVALGLGIDRDELRDRINRAIVTWPREIFDVPVER